MTVPEGFSLRAATPDDAAAIAEVINTCTLAEVGVPWTTPERVLTDLTDPEIESERDRPVLVDAGGTVRAHLQLDARGRPVEELEAIVWTEPAFDGRGLSSALLDVADERARSIASTQPEPFALLAARTLANAPAARLLERHGYAPTRTFHMMRIDLDETIPEPQTPDGLEIRPFTGEADERPTYEALMEAFADHWGVDDSSFESWRHRNLPAGTDTSLWFLAVDGDEVAGVAICEASSARSPGAAHIGDLAVRRRWRRRGLGLALLRTAFCEFARRGIARAELGVDSENPTGALRLYERAGMHVDFGWEFWRKDGA
jgi:mycothiol synthase